MSYYRNTFLKSEDWKNMRLHALLKHQCKCNLCGFASNSNDVHHVEYKRLFDVTVGDLKVLCRSCHNWTHKLLNRYPKMKKLPRKKLWSTVRAHFDRNIRYAEALRSIEQRKEVSLRALFSTVRKLLFESGLICRFRMRWSPQLEGKIAKDEITPENLIDAYLKHTGQDPRRFVLDIKRTFPKRAGQTWV